MNIDQSAACGHLSALLDCIQVEPRMDGSIGMMRLKQGPQVRDIYRAARAYLQGDHTYECSSCPEKFDTLFERDKHWAAVHG